MRSGPHQRNTGCREASSMFTVVTRVSDQASTGPRGVFSQSNPRTKSAISPSPMIRDDGRSPWDGSARVAGLERRDNGDMATPASVISEVALGFREDLETAAWLMKPTMRV